MKAYLLAFGLGLMLVGNAAAADLYVPQQSPEPYAETSAPVQASGWYLRGDVGYAFTDMRGSYYFPGGNYHAYDTADAKDFWTLGLGAGYQITKHFRVDVTGDYGFKSDFHGTTSTTGCGVAVCSSDDHGSVKLLSLLANAYVDLGTWHGVTPYVGAGIGGTHVDWGHFTSVGSAGCDECGGDYEGKSDWRFTYALMAGASVKLTCNLAFDASYRYRHINGGGMSEDFPGGGAGRAYDDGFNVQDVRGGLRYTFGGCAQPQLAAYKPAPMPVYK